MGLESFIMMPSAVQERAKKNSKCLKDALQEASDLMANPSRHYSIEHIEHVRNLVFDARASTTSLEVFHTDIMNKGIPV